MGTLAWAAPAGAIVFSHNGTVTSTPPGNGNTNVALGCPVNSSGTADCTKQFFDSEALHSMTFQTDDDSTGTLSETIINETPIPWTDFHFTFHPESFVQNFEFEFSNLGPGVVAQRSSDDALWLFFENPILQEASFTIDFNFSGLAESGEEGGEDVAFNIGITQLPSTAPEPGTLGLAAVGLGGLAALRRRKKRGDAIKDA